MRKFVIVTFLIAYSIFCVGQSNYTFTIKEDFFNGYFNKYAYKNYKISIFDDLEFVHEIKLSEKQKLKLDSIISCIEKADLRGTYNYRSYTCKYNEVIWNGRNIVDDGVRISFDLKFNGKENSFVLENYYHKELDVLISYINSLIEEKARLISFGNNIYLNPDTVIFCLPDFLDGNIQLLDTNYRITDITCYKNGYFVTDLLDSTLQCKCRISVKDSFYARIYWKVYRLNERNWKIEYYDSNNQIYKTEYLEEVIPFEFSNELIVIQEGTRPSTKIKKYYKTKILDL